MIVAKICVYLMVAVIIYGLFNFFYQMLQDSETILQAIEAVVYILLFLPMIVFLVWYVLIRFLLGKKTEDD